MDSFELYAKSPENGPWARPLGWQFEAVEEVASQVKELLIPPIADVAVLSVDVNIEIVRVDAQCIADGAECPVCGVWSSRVHGSCLRFPADVPIGGRSSSLEAPPPTPRRPARSRTSGTSGTT
ncbi:hypothetical protein [Streptomyces sp. NPDC026673]|uniref:hypothetical protein n=1 Tax=Streptomyces sp. NPDC026673 TaxID=3155724 RepID=UPI0033ED5AF2